MTFHNNFYSNVMGLADPSGTSSTRQQSVPALGYFDKMRTQFEFTHSEKLLVKTNLVSVQH